MDADRNNVTDTTFPSVTLAQKATADVPNPMFANWRKLFVDESDRVNLRDDAGVDTPLATQAEADRVIHSVICVPDATPLMDATTPKLFRFPCAMTITDVRAHVAGAPTGSGISVDVMVGGEALFTSSLKIDEGQMTSVTSVAPVSIDPLFASVADDADAAVTIGSVGSATPGSGLTLVFYGTRS